MPFVAIRCPNCNASLNVDPAAGTARCEFCHTTLVSRRTLEILQPQAAAEAAAEGDGQTWWNRFLAETGGMKKPAYSSEHVRQAYLLSRGSDRDRIRSDFSRYAGKNVEALIESYNIRRQEYKMQMSRTPGLRVLNAVLLDLFALIILVGIWAAAMFVFNLPRWLDSGILSFRWLWDLNPLCWLFTILYAPFAAYVLFLLVGDPLHRKSARQSVKKIRPAAEQLIQDAAFMQIDLPPGIHKLDYEYYTHYEPDPADDPAGEGLQTE